VKSIYLFLISLFVNISVLFAQSGPRDLQNIQYGTARQNTLDLYLPAKYNTVTPVIILLHGGAWTIGGKEYTVKTAKDLRDRGFIVANVDYRYVSSSLHCKDLLTDIDNAYTCLQQQSQEYHFKNNNYHLAGISAGAHLALLYGYTSTKLINSITALCAPSRLDDAGMFKQLEKKGLLTTIEQLADAKYVPGKKVSPAFTVVSPYSKVKAIPTLLFHGDKDDLVPFSQSQYLYQVLQQKKVVSKFIPMPGKGHDCGMNQPDSENKVLGEIQAWVLKYN
jgi:acetyl esterase/lipase